MCVYGPPGPGFENTDLNKTILDMSSGLILPKRNEWLYFFLDHLRQKEGCLCVCVCGLNEARAVENRNSMNSMTFWVSYHIALCVI